MMLSALGSLWDMVVAINGCAAVLAGFDTVKLPSGAAA